MLHLDLPWLMLLSVAAQQPDQPRPVTAATAIRLSQRGAVLVEDFDGPELDTTLWRVWQQDPEATTVAQQNGRLELTARGKVSMNGLWGLATGTDKDVTLAAEMDVRSTGAVPHRLALHLCGGDGNRSPDHWTEIDLIDQGETARFTSMSALPDGYEKHQMQFIDLPHPAGQGFLCRIDLNAVTNLADLYVKAADGWRRICDPIEVPLRTVHTEVKFNGLYGQGDPTDAAGTAWFDNVRIYPRPESHYVGLRLVRADGSPIWTRPGGGWPPRILDAEGKDRPINDLHVELRTADGETLVAAEQGPNFGFYLLSLKEAPWDIYPVAAQVRVILDGKVLGAPLRIEQQGCDGLYPDDVYEVVID